MTIHRDSDFPLSQERANFSRRALAILGGCILFATLLGQAFVDSSVAGLEEEPQLLRQKGDFGSFQNGPGDSYTINIDGTDTSSLQFPPPTRPELPSRDLPSVTNSQLGSKLEWHRFFQTPTRSLLKRKSDHPHSSKKLLIAQYSATAKEADLFAETKIVNLEYAKRWNHDVVFLNAPGKSRSEANLATLLHLGWELREEYDQILILDNDTLLNRFSKDVTNLMTSQYDMVVAKRQRGVKGSRTPKVYSGATLWNLKHLLVPIVAKNWMEQYQTGRPKDRPQFLAKALFSYGSETRSVSDEINNKDNAHVKVFEWRSKTDLNGKIKKLKKETRKVCRKYKFDCNT